MGEFNLRECVIFLLFIYLIFLDTFEEHRKKIEAVCSRQHEHALKLKLSMYDFFKVVLVIFDMFLVLKV